MEIEQTSITNWCDMLVETYNTSILTNFPKELTKALEEEAIKCVQNKPNPHGKGRKILMRLINNHFNKSGNKPKPLYIKGPYTLTLQFHKEQKKSIYIFGEKHSGNTDCPITKDEKEAMLAEDYFEQIFTDPDYFYEFFFEIDKFDGTGYGGFKFVNDEDFVFGDKNITRLDILREKNKDCMGEDSWVKEKCQLGRVHYIDIRTLINPNKTHTEKYYTEFLQMQLDLHSILSKVKNSYDEVDLAIINEHLKDKIKKQQLRAELNNFYIQYKNILLQIRSDTTLFSTMEETEEKVYKIWYDQYNNFEFINSKQEKSYYNKEIKKFILDHIKKFYKDYHYLLNMIMPELVSGEDLKSERITMFEKENTLSLEFFKLYDLLDPLYTIIRSFNSIIMDAYTLSRIFKTFNLKDPEKDGRIRPTDEPEKAHNIIIYAGNEHSKRYREFLQLVGFELISKSGTNFPDDEGDYKKNYENCVDMSPFKQPFFSEWPPTQKKDTIKSNKRTNTTDTDTDTYTYDYDYDYDYTYDSFPKQKKHNYIHDPMNIN